MSGRHQLSELRDSNWNTIPETPGFYTWYFEPKIAKGLLKTLNLKAESLDLKTADNGYLALYCGIAKDLKQRVDWHASQSLNFSALKSGFLSTLRFTLLALTNSPYNHPRTESKLNRLLDSCLFQWQATKSKKDAEAVEQTTLQRGCYPLNLQNNRRPELSESKRMLSRLRTEYKAEFLQEEPPAVTQPKTKSKAPSEKIQQYATYDPYTILRLPNGSIKVYQLTEKAKPHLREIAEKIGVNISDKNGKTKTTHQLGRDIIKQLLENGS